MDNKQEQCPYCHAQVHQGKLADNAENQHFWASNAFY